MGHSTDEIVSLEKKKLNAFLSQLIAINFLEERNVENILLNACLRENRLVILKNNFQMLVMIKCSSDT